ncbi:hypothetical protein MRB53_020577 [Persea americana]|uniref:Uncharacterized protein n=1 Tax=Persea americana TaxID=3435 RepID=A0ACC2L1I8_PERAE|nr:hypothetical protein MRB53_020577 [Persea americana]
MWKSTERASLRFTESKRRIYVRKRTFSIRALLSRIWCFDSRLKTHSEQGEKKTDFSCEIFAGGDLDTRFSMYSLAVCTW